MASHEFDAALSGISLVSSTRRRGSRPPFTLCHLFSRFISFAVHAVLHGVRSPPPLSYLRLTGFLVIVLSMALMAPASMWVRMGATRINELIALSNRPALHDRVDLNPSPRVRRACQVAIFALVMQASNHVRFEEVATCACSDGDYFIQHAVNACCCPVILLVSVPPGQLCFRSRSLFS